MVAVEGYIHDAMRRLGQVSTAVLMHGLTFHDPLVIQGPTDP